MLHLLIIFACEGFYTWLYPSDRPLGFYLPHVDCLVPESVSLCHERTRGSALRHGDAVQLPDKDTASLLRGVSAIGGEAIQHLFWSHPTGGGRGYFGQPFLRNSSSNRRWKQKRLFERAL